MELCVYCHKAKGVRKCPALSGHICPPCCGEHRGTEIDCPPSCPYYQRHEGYQRERLGLEFHKRWLASNEQLYNEGQEGLLNFIFYLEFLIHRYYRERTRGTDEQVLEGLEFARRRLGPLELVESPIQPGLGQHLQEGIEGYLREQGLREEDALQGVEATISFLKEFSGEDENPRRYLQGLMGHVERDFNLPQKDEEGPTPSLIVTPDQLRREINRQPNSRRLPRGIHRGARADSR